MAAPGIRRGGRVPSGLWPGKHFQTDFAADLSRDTDYFVFSVCSDFGSKATGD